VAISVTLLRLIRFIPWGLHEILKYYNKVRKKKKVSKATVGAKSEVEHIQGEN
jgi:hypothetical protein